ncbi:olfactory receptor 14C36-like, partial [Alligator sinensis]|uniref:Olfactory receptor n=1 Tax=Alligator sinensis TaxID=38654 RepID=A0A3Q0FW95_ALLSI
MMTSNCTAVTEFLLLGFSDALGLHILHLATFLTIYRAALIGNLLVIMLIAVDSHLHTPMYFFLLNLSILDIGSISVIVPKSTANAILNTRLISYSGCVTQVFLFLFFITADLFVLTVMAYDRYIAICKPLHYATVMNRRACLLMAAAAWSAALLNSALHTGNTFRLPFCHSNIVNQFFCEIPRLLRISGSEVFTSEIQIIIFG